MKYFLLSAGLHVLFILGFFLTSQTKVVKNSWARRAPVKVFLWSLPDEWVSTPEPLRRLKGSVKKNRGQKAEVGQKRGQAQGVETTEAGFPQGDWLKKLRLSYAQALYVFISNHQVYPQKARKLHQVGTVSVGFHVTSSGEFQKIHLKKGCDCGSLDQAALELIKGLKRFKPLPKALGRGQDFVVPIQYTMTKGI